MNLVSGEMVSHYRILERLGEGGMGVVYKAEDTQLKRHVALKFLPHEVMATPHAKERFLHEAETTSALDHPNICTIHEINHTEGGQFFLVLSCYEGKTLRKILEEGRLSIGQAIQIAAQLCEGLAAAHDHKIVHRDLKPENIMVLSTGLVKILDFGLAKLAGQTQLTMSGTTMGTAAYMSPEQANGESVDERTDIYSVGVILYEMLTGELPFRADHPLALMYLIINQTPRSPEEINSAIPKALSDAVVRCLHKKRESRFQSAGDLREELLAHASGVVPHLSGERISLEKVRKQRGFGRRTVLAAVVSVVLIVVGGVVFKLLSPKSADTTLARVHLSQAHDDLQNNDLSSAKRSLLAALDADPQFVTAWSTLSAVEMKLGRVEQAVKDARRAVDLDSNSTAALYNLAYGLEEQGNYADALRYYGRAVLIDTEFVEAQSALGSLYVKLGEPARAIEVLQNALTKNSESPHAYLLEKNLGKAYLRSGMVDQAIAAFERSIKLQPAQKGEPLHQLALAYEAKGMRREARASALKCLEADTDTLRQRQMRELLARISAK